LKSDAAELLMTEMLELRRMQISARVSQDEPTDVRKVELKSDNDNMEFPSILAAEKPTPAPLFEAKMPPRPLLELAKEGYEALQAMSRERAESA
jgi:hypothetical protein